MFDRICFPTDGSDAAEGALESVLDLAAGTGATVHLLNVADTTRDSVTTLRGQVVDLLEEEGERIVEAAADRAAERGVATVTEVAQGHPARTVVEYAAANDCDAIAMATHGRRGIGRLLMGSVAERVVRTATVPVLTFRADAETPAYPYGDVLVPTDGSDPAAAALEAGIRVATGTGGALHVLQVVDTTGLGVDVRSVAAADRLDRAARTTVDAAVERAREAGVESVEGTVEDGRVVKRIREYVRANGVELVVMGTHGRTGLDRYLLGSVAENLVRTSPVPVLTVRADADGETSEEDGETSEEDGEASERDREE